jgi:hypothetical protein
MQSPPTTVADLLPDFRNTRRLPEWLHDESTPFLDLVRTQAVDGRAEQASELLVEVWPLVPADVGEPVLRHLHECGVFLASVLPTSLLVARACRLGAGVQRTRGLCRLASAEGCSRSPSLSTNGWATSCPLPTPAPCSVVRSDFSATTPPPTASSTGHSPRSSGQTTPQPVVCGTSQPASDSSNRTCREQLTQV